MKTRIFFSLALVTFASAVFAQQNKDAVLMTIGNDKVTVDEFLSVFKKNNKESASMDKKSMGEYLDLYTVFRLKVKEAKELGIDTTKSFRDELAGYRKTLAQPYLTEKDAIDNLVKEAYDRMKWEIRTSHILVKMDADADTAEAYTKAMLIRDFLNGKPNAAGLKKYEAMVKSELKISKTSPAKDTLAAFNKINPLKNMMKLKAHDFASVARAVSDHGSKVNGGDLGYMSGLTPGYPYEYENAACKATQGTVYGPFRTPLGYHLLLVTDKRPHRELHLEHVMLLFRKNMKHEDSVKIKMKIDSIAGLVKNGTSFEELAAKVSDHKESGKRGGDIGWVSMGSNFPQEFKDAAFAIKANGGISEPVRTRFGWHLIKRISERELQPFDSVKADLKTRVQKDARASVAKEMMIARMKTKYGFKETSPKNVSDFYAVADSTLPAGQWKAEKAAALTKPMFTLADKSYSQQDFAHYIERNFRTAARLSSPKKMVDALYKSFVEETVLNTLDSRLEEEHPDFRMLMAEYRDGILLFNLTDQKVWSKAIKDTVGAKEYYEKNKDHFMWDDRLDASIYTVKDEKTAEKVRKMLKSNKSDKEILAALNKDTVINVTAESRLFQKGDNGMLDQTGWTPGVTPNQNVKGKIVFANIRKIVKPTPKSYSEARGLVTSEYQTWLEKEWVDSLKKKYTVAVDKNVFNSIQ